MLRLMSFMHFLKHIQASIHIKSDIKIKNIGSIAVSSILKIELDGANIKVSVSDTKQSNDKNTSDDDPIRLAGSNASVIASGNLRLNDIAAVNSWR